MNGRTRSRVLGLTFVTLFLVGWSGEAAPAAGGGVKLLFAHSPGCSHCAYQRPIIREFTTKHPEVEVSWVRYGDLDREQRKLVEGTSGHPVMVFHNGGHIRQVVGETSLDSLDREYKAFREQLEKPEASRTRSGSKTVCR